MKNILRLCFPKWEVANGSKRIRFNIWAFINIIGVICICGEICFDLDISIADFLLLTVGIYTMESVFSNRNYLKATAEGCLENDKLYCLYIYAVGIIYLIIFNAILLLFEDYTSVADYVHQYGILSIYMFISIPLIVIKDLKRWWIAAIANIVILNSCIFVFQQVMTSVVIESAIVLTSFIGGFVVSYVLKKKGYFYEKHK